MTLQYGKIPRIDKPLSRLIQGTVMLSSDRMEESFELLDTIFALGCTAFDTAAIYGDGDSERVLGHWMSERGVRDELVVFTKGAHHNQDRKRVTPYDITADIYDSLARLQVDHIDLYLLHRDDPSVPVEPIVDILNEHQAAGRIKAFGGSNWSYERIRQANAYAQAAGLIPFAVSSPNFSLAEQIQPPWDGCVTVSGPANQSIRETYQQEQMPLLTWSSLAGGFFSGRFQRDNLDSFESYLDKLCVTSYCNEANFQRLDRAETLAQKKGLTLPQIALAYVLNQPLNIFALVGCNNGAEFEANIAALDITLSQAEMDWLDLRRDEV